jgi:hypothetical protein
MTVLALIGIKVALNSITPTVSLMTDYSVLTDREINHLRVWTHNTSYVDIVKIKIEIK